MQFLINGLQISNLQKARDGIVTVDIIANHLTEDQEGETVLKEAFTPEEVQNFLGVGVIDFWHESDNPALTKADQNAAIIGKPIAFRWEKDLPIVTAELTENHPRVMEMLPHLQARQPVYAASLAGSKMVLETKDSEGGLHRIIPKIKWNKLAIAPAPMVINRAPGMNVRLLQKAKDIMCEFDDMNTFMRNSNHVIAQEEVLMKALTAPSSAADLYTAPGGVTVKQDIEKTPVNLTLSDQDGLDLIDTIIGIKDKRIPLKKAEYIDHFKQQKKEDFGHKSYGLIDKYFKSKKGAK
jgi:hypothetical protein